jgi:hypothetical protein
MDSTDILRKEKEVLVMNFMKKNGIYEFLAKKFNELYELPIKPENPL